MKNESTCSINLASVLETVKEKLAGSGIEFESSCGDTAGGTEARVKVVCVTPDMRKSVEEMGACCRDQVVMVRVDEETAEQLDAWVETGAVRSRSEAAALFIREGLNVRKTELERLRDALRSVKEAKDQLRKQASKVFGSEEQGE